MRARTMLAVLGVGLSGGCGLIFGFQEPIPPGGTGGTGGHGGAGDTSSSTSSPDTTSSGQTSGTTSSTSGAGSTGSSSSMSSTSGVNTTTSTTSGGTCSGGCTPPDPMHGSCSGTVCNPGSMMCDQTEAPNGTPCSSGSPPVAGTCQKGSCVPDSVSSDGGTMNCSKTFPLCPAMQCCCAVNTPNATQGTCEDMTMCTQSMVNHCLM